MSKIAINNEIVLMRQAVRQSRVRVVRTLIKEAKRLKARQHGDEKLLEKCKRKAEKLVAEIIAAKKIKDDEISKFGITEKRSYREILSDPSSQPSTRVMTKFANHKILSNRIRQFKEKFPVYEEHLEPGRKKLSKIQRKANREMRIKLKETQNALSDNNSESKLEHEEMENSGEDDSENPDLDAESDENVLEDDIDENEEKVESIGDDSEPGSIPRIKSNSVSKRKNDVKTDSEAKAKPEKRRKQEKSKLTGNSVESKKPILAKVVSEEATVKRFSDLIEETDVVVEPSAVNSRKNEIKIEKQADPFFMTENGESDYMSVVVPKLMPCEDEQEDDKFLSPRAQRQKNFHEKKNKFFSKIDERSSRYFGEKHVSKMEKRGNSYLSGGKAPLEKPSRVGKDRMKYGKNVKADPSQKGSVNEEELHPSWVARKKQQEILKQGFQGKKIIFED